MPDAVIPVVVKAPMCKSLYEAIVTSPAVVPASVVKPIANSSADSSQSIIALLDAPRSMMIPPSTVPLPPDDNNMIGSATVVFVVSTVVVVPFTVKLPLTVKLLP